MADDFLKIDPSNPITWLVGGILGLVGIAIAAGMNKPAGGPVSSTSTMTDSTPAPAKKAGCGCSAHS